MRITKHTKLREINDAPFFSQAKGHFIGGGETFFEGDNAEMTLEELQEKNPTWNHEDVIFGLKRLREISERGGQYVYPVYTPQEEEQDPRLSQVRLFYLPTDKKTVSSYAILSAGGSYGAVCTLVESLPVAAKLNELGVTCFCLNYRTATPESFINGLMPKPLDDYAAAWRLIKKHQDDFSVNAADYFAGGFSAGGHCAAMWGTKHLGYGKYGIPAPKMLILIYPLVTLEAISSAPMKDYICKGLFGERYTDDDIIRYAPSRHVDGEYPKVFYAVCMDEAEDMRSNADIMEDALAAAGVLHRIERPARGGHGFGLGSAIDAKGWVERALTFYGETR